MIRIAKFKSRNIKNIHFALGSSRHVPFKRKFDMICTVLSFHHWQKKSESLKYLSAFLEKGGEIRIYEYEARKIRGIHRFALPSHAIDKQELYKTARESGLVVYKIHQESALVRISLKKK